MALHVNPEGGLKGSQKIFIDLVDVDNPQVRLHEKAAFYLP